ncbi:cell division protein FtsL [Paraburkholderia humisilvae]|uniref:Cell division protein FtsL n=1 Tax=Paraburkholderia humisilvae TaxID=627669 RepID=A0A6J5EAB7_9BURK|nr:cell division protein FtsL [Paraburkholderia humisilvae]CAB3763448.1 Cell division protein FtsL [Paraburkholderia humisilvae]
MNRLNIFLLIVVMGCALSVVNATNQQRQIFIQLQRAQSQERQLQQDYSQLQYQQSALSKTSRIEQIATDSLKMQQATTGRTQYVVLDPGAATAEDASIPTSAPASAPLNAQPARSSQAASARGGTR